MEERTNGSCKSSCVVSGRTITQSMLDAWMDAAYCTIVEKGFRVDASEVPIEESLMLIVSELSEAVEADRKGHRARYDAMEYCDKHVEDFDVESRKRYFERDVKDTLEDELADVCIRIFSMCKVFGYELSVSYYRLIPRYFDAIDRGKSFCQRCFCATRLLCDDFMRYGRETTINRVWFYVFDICDEMHIDIVRHIDMKMRYNKMRPLRNGKRY